MRTFTKKIVSKRTIIQAVIGVSIYIVYVKINLYKPDKERPGNNFSCSKCLQCVASCPNGSLWYTAKLSYKTTSTYR